MSVRTVYLVAAAINAIIAFLLPSHYWPVNALMVIGLIVLAFVERRPRANDRQLLTQLALVTIATAFGSVAAGKNGLYIFLGLCCVIAFFEGWARDGAY